MKANFRFLNFLFWNSIYIGVMIWIGYETWTKQVPIWFGVVALIFSSGAGKACLPHIAGQGLITMDILNEYYIIQDWNLN